MPQSIKFPLSLGIEKDFKDFDNNKQLVAFQLKNVLFTNPGERISIPSFGVGIKRYLFEMNGDSTASIIRSRIVQQVNSYIPGIVLNNVNVFSVDENSISIQISYRLNSGFFEESDGQILTSDFDISTNVSPGQVNYWGIKYAQKTSN